MSNYTKSTNFTAKDSLPTGDTNKVIRGSEFDTEFDAIQTAVGTKSDLAGPTFTGTATFANLTATGTVNFTGGSVTTNIDGGTIDGVTIGGSSAGAGTFSSLTATTADINGGTVDGVTIGGSSAGAGTFSSLVATTADINAGTVDNTVIGGTTPAAGTFSSLTATTANIDGGNIDGTVIGASSTAAISGTTGTFSGAVTGSNLNVSNWDTAFGWGNHATQGYLTSVTFSNIDAGAVTLSSETFADSDTQIPTNAAVIDYVAATIPLITEVNDLTVSVTWANVPDANITQSSVTQHQAALSLTSSQVSGLSSFTATASGALSNGDTVIINSDGTVTAVGTSVSALNPPTKGTAAEFEAGGTGNIAAVFDPDNNKVVVAYSDAGDSDKGKAAVGTVSGTSISFGTPVEFEAGGTSYIAVTYDTNADKVVIAYADAGNSSGAGTAIVGTVSGTSISFGTAVVYNNAETTYQGITFDSSNNKVVVCYRDNGNSNYGTAIVGTVSGTSISFGSEVVFNSANTFYPSATFDSSNNKVVIAYRDQGDSNKGTAIVGTVSGTSISFGSEVVFDGNNGSEWTAATFDSNSNKVVIFYQDDTDTETNAIVGTVSGTSISFGTAVQVLDGNNVYHNATFNSTANTVLVVLQEETTEDIELFIGTVSGTSITFGTALKVAEHAAQVAVVYDTNAQKGVVLYDDDDDSSKGKGVVTTVNTTTTNLTPENYVGIANGAYSDAATATIQISGSLDDAQSSLTPGQVYYVQGDGSLGLKPDVPAVVAGIAISSTKLMLELSKEPAVTEQNSTAITSSSNAATINLRDGDNFTHTLTENVTYTFSNPAASGRVSAFTLKVIQDSSARTITWPSSVDWAAATAPTLTATSGGVDVFVFVTYDGGTTYYGFTAGQAMA